MKLCVETFRLPKAGNALDEYEDASWPESSCVASGATIRVAVADGATETSFAGEWARLLVRAWGDRRFADRSWTAELAVLGDTWLRTVSKASLPWYAEEKLRSGAYSSLLGVSIHARKNGTRMWHCSAVGDSCLFHVRAGRMIRSFPLVAPDEFDRRPMLISSSPSPSSRIEERIARISAVWTAGDSLYLMTDALARWFLTYRPASIQALAAIRDESAFYRLIADMREASAMRNDDVTLLRLTLP